MKALTVRPPWSGLIMYGGKTHENRTWPSSFRGHIAVHASAKSGRDDKQEALELYEQIRGRALSGIDEYKWWSEKVCAVGVILGTVRMDGFVTASDSPWFFGQYGFVLSDPRPLAVPIPVLGKLGFWDLPADIEAKVLAETALKL